MKKESTVKKSTTKKSTVKKITVKKTAVKKQTRNSCYDPDDAAYINEVNMLIDLM